MTQSERSLLESMGRVLSDLIGEAWGELAAERGVGGPALLSRKTGPGEMDEAPIHR
jgi:hypothetical protein